MELLNQALVENPDAYSLNLDKANVLDQLDRDIEARAIYEELLTDHGDDTSLLRDMASLSLDEGSYARAADFYVRVVDLNEADTDPLNDDDNKAMLMSAGSWYALRSVGRYDDAITSLERAAELDMFLNEKTMLARTKTYYKYGMKLKGDAAAEMDEILKADLTARSMEKLNRSVEIGIAMTNNFTFNADGFLALSMAQVEIGEFEASEANYKTYNELSEQPDAGSF